MGLLRKKSSELDASAAAAVLPAPSAEAPVPAEPAAPAPTATSDGVPAASGDAAVEPAADAPAEEAPEAAEGADVLLNMFSSTQAEADDRELLLSMAGEIDLADLIDEVQTVAAALNIITRAGE